jgi:cytochrome c oxidase subunit 1
MSKEQTHHEEHGHGHGDGHGHGHHGNYLTADKGVMSWLLTKDHKRIALMFFAATTVALMAGGTFALLVRTELLTAGRTIMDATSYNRAFTLHGVIMVFMFMIPAIPGFMGNFALPIMIGAKDVAFPKLNLGSFYLYLGGAGIALLGLIAGGADTGWTFYLPYSSSTPLAVAPIGIGIFIMGLSSIATGLNFIATVHTMRTKGLGWHQMPLFVWAIYATSVIQVLATPVIGLSVLLVFMDATFGFGIFDPAVGGDPVLFQHLFWFYSHPAVYIMILPSLGVMTEVACTFSHNVPASYQFIAYSSLGIAFVGFVTWGHHMFVAGISEFNAGIFGILSMFVAIFSAVKVFTWVATLYKGRITFNTPMLYFFWFLFLFIYGGMTGVAIATSSLDVHWHDTYFIVAHFHFIMVGSTITAWLAGIHYWFPKMFGKMYNERAGLFGSLMVFMGFVLTFLPQFLLGNAGMPRRYFSYPEKFQMLNVLSTAGATLLALGMLFTLGYLIAALIWGEKAERNPWQSRSFEWLADSPPSKHNFDEPFIVKRGPYDYHLPEK